MAKTAHAKWVSDLHFSAEVSSEHWLELDGEGGLDVGPRPKELLLAALCGCTGMDVASVMRKKRAAFDNLELSAEGTEAEEHPQVFTEVRVTYTLKGPEASREAFERAVELSWTKYCPVVAMLRKALPLQYRTVFNGEPGAFRS